MPFPQALVSRLKELSPLALAYSGGLDSRFLAHAAQALAGQGVTQHLFHVTGPQVPKAESREALAWAEARGLPLTRLAFDPLGIPEVRAGGRERCYYCKKAMFKLLRDTLARYPLGAGQSPVLCDGSNASDASQYRPGLRALRELGVRSPLAEAGLGKEGIRALAAQSGLERPEQPARPCLLTRLAYGLTPDKELLSALDAAETELTSLLGSGLATGHPVPDFRLRLTARESGAAAERGLAAYRAELHVGVASCPPGLEDQLVAAVERHGFARPYLLLSEQVSGHYDRDAEA